MIEQSAPKAWTTKQKRLSLPLMFSTTPSLITRSKYVVQISQYFKDSSQRRHNQLMSLRNSNSRFLYGYSLYLAIPLMLRRYRSMRLPEWFMYPSFSVLKEGISTQTFFYQQRQMSKIFNLTGATLLPLMHFILGKLDEDREIGISSYIYPSKALEVNSDMANKISGLKGKVTYL